MANDSYNPLVLNKVLTNQSKDCQRFPNCVACRKGGGDVGSLRGGISCMYEENIFLFERNMGTR